MLPQDGQVVHHKLQHAVGHEITIGDVYGALGTDFHNPTSILILRVTHP